MPPGGGKESWRLLFLSPGLLLLIVTPHAILAAPLTSEVTWHESLSAARAAATVSGKPILAIGYRQNHEACETLIDSILPHPDVVVQLDSLELYAADVDNPTSADFCRRYQVGVVSADNTWLVAQPILPVLLFLDANGREYFRDYGTVSPPPSHDSQSDLESVAAKGFVSRVQTILQLVSAMRQIAESPTAQAHAQAGHILMEMEQFEDARPQLEKAKQLDPNNETGAFADAYFDTIVLGIAEDPDLAYKQFDDYMVRYRDSERLLEARYYKGVCLVVLERYADAIKVFQTFETDDKKAPEFDSPWTPLALGLLKELRKPSQTR